MLNSGNLEQITLACTVHDPNGVFIPLLKNWFSTVQKLFKFIIVSSSPDLYTGTRQFLEESGVFVKELEKNKIGLNYRQALGLGAKYGDIFYCDLDRILHWAGNYADELADLAAGLQGKTWVVFERTERAMQTHQRALQETEAKFSEFIAKNTDFGLHDWLSGAFLINKTIPAAGNPPRRPVCLKV